MSGDSSTSEESLGSTAFIVVEEADCFYEPTHTSAVRMTPPLNSLVEVVRQHEDWILIRYFGKEAWCERLKLGTAEVQRPFDISPYIFPATNKPDFTNATPYSTVEYGPRGGRYTRTRTGYRRYF